MFRVKLKVDAQVLQKFYTRVKTGVRGLGFVRTKADLEWPADLQVKLPTPPADKTSETCPRQQRSRNQNARRQMTGDIRQCLMRVWAPGRGRG